MVQYLEKKLQKFPKCVGCAQMCEQMPLELPFHMMLFQQPGVLSPQPIIGKNQNQSSTPRDHCTNNPN